MSAKNQHSLEEAAQWRLRLEQEPSLELSPDFQAWISETENGRALIAIDQGRAAVMAQSSTQQMLKLRAKAIRNARRSGTIRGLSRRTLFRGIAAMLLVAIVGSGALFAYLYSASVYGSEIGERRIVTLADGTRILLDSDTQIHVRYTDKARTITLERGRARFDVAHDMTRPFSVRAGSETVVAIGTSFNVEIIGSKVFVTLIRGHVAIKHAQASSQQRPHDALLSLNAGEELIVSQNARPIVNAANLQAATAWEAGQLIFRDARLEEAVARENRYTNKPIIVDPSVASLRISGAFNAGDVASFVSAVANYFHVQATTTADDQILLQQRS